jgi:hypothetical protein
LDLTGGPPTNSLWLEWGTQDPSSSVGEEASSLHPRFEEQVDDLHPWCPTGEVEDSEDSVQAFTPQPFAYRFYGVPFGFQSAQGNERTAKFETGMG